MIDFDVQERLPREPFDLGNLPLRAEWVLVLGPQERITPRLRNEVMQAVRNSSPANGYFARSLVVFMGRAMANGGPQPSWGLRLCRRQAVRLRYVDSRPVLTCPGLTGRLVGQIVQAPPSSIADFIGKLIERAEDNSARSADISSQGASPPHGLRRLVGMYIFRGGFLQGRAGEARCA